MATGVGHLIASSFQWIELQSEVNGQLPQPAKFERLFWSFYQLKQLRRLQRSLLPQSPRLRKAVRFHAIGFSLFFLGTALLLFGLKGVYRLCSPPRPLRFTVTFWLARESHL
jgi:hypothetical protein